LLTEEILLLPSTNLPPVALSKCTGEPRWWLLGELKGLFPVGVKGNYLYLAGGLQAACVDIAAQGKLRWTVLIPGRQPIVDALLLSKSLLVATDRKVLLIDLKQPVIKHSFKWMLSGNPINGIWATEELLLVVAYRLRKGDIAKLQLLPCRIDPAQGAEITEQQLKRLISELEHESFMIRERATRKLLAAAHKPEVKRQLERVARSSSAEAAWRAQWILQSRRETILFEKIK
jgi:hypothetical protein